MYNKMEERQYYNFHPSYLYIFLYVLMTRKLHKICDRTAGAQVIASVERIRPHVLKDVKFAI